jgi:hypothetical protein
VVLPCLGYKIAVCFSYDAREAGEWFFFLMCGDHSGNPPLDFATVEMAATAHKDNASIISSSVTVVRQFLAVLIVPSFASK